MDKTIVVLDSLHCEEIYFRMVAKDYMNNESYKDYPISYKEVETDGRYVYVEISYTDSFSLFVLGQSLGRHYSRSL